MIVKYEIACFDFESAMLAQKAGADRVELCSNQPEGGVTPSYGLIDLARKNLHIDLNVIIRPRGGNFVYTDSELNIMENDILVCKELGINGVVFGVLNEDKTIDKTVNSELVQIASPLATTFHRAFDETPDAMKALEDVIDCGFTRILTSGQKISAIEGTKLISGLIEAAGQKIIIMPGGGIRKENIKELIQITKAKEYHSSSTGIIK
ncbi:MAG: copper homeostasis protein CutC [Ignavibacteriae bacterium]|nr:copper homeostasis protein CutC [Ignavibacteriota bacterium]